MFTAGDKYSRERGRARRIRLRLVLLLICLTAFYPGTERDAMKLTQVSLADIVPSPPARTS